MRVDETLRRLEFMPCAGLANRMGALASAMVVAQEAGAELVVGWKWDQGAMTGDFSDLFDMNALPSWMTVIEMRLKPDPVLDLSPETNSEKAWGKFVTRAEGPVWRFKSWASFYAARSTPWVQSLRLLRPHPSINTEIYRIRKLLSYQPSVGVHIRRTDHKDAIQASPSAAFWEAMSEASPNIRFYVASDSESEREEARRRYKTRVITGPKRIRGRGCLKGCRDALVDFYSLAACGEIWGSRGSTFGALAAAYGGGVYRDIVARLADG